ncbi:hypothetical protein JFV29_14100 [Peribacillus sp. TH16]|uniref:hypothetical protein n=1 Tax=Peribacillus sp. TH16 TaxID=2798482 RepID=UPI001913E6FA|nr:hypothetical protein [Peribacillus sp. TH16]MBK5482979.1 hypothetical protein [Peribacillus sp. TH16]MBK5483003.1 hypothetical protein [Peribacillus sp. TH16]
MAKTTIENIGERKELSDEALERFVEIYLKMVKENELKLTKKRTAHNRAVPNPN